MSNSKSSTERCLHCHISAPGNSKIYDDVSTRCLKNRKGACVGCQKLLDVERKIEETRCTLDTLLKEREALASTLNEYHDPLSRQLPVEIASQIFLRCLSVKPEDLINEQIYEEKELIESVFLPGHVSKHWRNIAKRTPKMWSIIFITIKRSNSLSSVRIVREWLEQSGESPLSIRLAVGPTLPIDEVVSSILQKVIVLMIQHSHRWKLLDLDVPDDLLPWISNAMPNQHLDCLEHIKLCVTGTWFDDLEAKSILNLQASPRRLTQGNIRLRQIVFNMEHLTDFRSDFAIDINDCLKLFQVSPRLSHCTLWRGVKGHASSDTFVSCASLLNLLAAEFSPNWWNSFTFPSLETLVVINLCEESWTHLHDCLQRSGCKIKRFCIIYTEKATPDMPVLDIFKLTPDLRQLELSGRFQEPFFSLMDAAASSTTGFLKNLTSLICHINDKEFNWTWLLVFLTTMTTRQEKSLRSLEFLYTGGLSDESKPGTLKDKKTFDLILGVMEDVELKVVDNCEVDLIESLREHYNI